MRTLSSVLVPLLDRAVRPLSRLSRHDAKPAVSSRGITRRRAWLAASLAAVLFAGVPFNDGAQARDSRGDQWVGTWATSPQTPAVAPRVFPAQTTLRQVLRVSLGGHIVRVRFSNELGTTPLVIGAASIARRGADSAIVAGSDHALTFGGKASIAIPPGAPVLSDPVRMDVRALADLAVSIYLPEGASGTTFHSVGLQTSYIAPAGGDYTQAVVLPAGETTLNSFFLTGVNVLVSDDAVAIVTLGDSITDGTRSTPDTNSRWPNVLARRLQATHDLEDVGVVNHGISGNRLFSGTAGPNTLSRFDRDVLAAPGRKFVIVLIGINDIGNGARGTGPVVTADDVIGGYRQIIARAHEHGLIVYGATLTPIGGAAYDVGNAEAIRQAVNAWIRTSGEFDAVIDFDRLTRDPAQPTRFLPAYDSGDHLHPNDLGYRAMGEAIPLKLFREKRGAFIDSPSFPFR